MNIPDRAGLLTEDKINVFKNHLDICFFVITCVNQMKDYKKLARHTHSEIYIYRLYSEIIYLNFVHFEHQ